MEETGRFRPYAEGYIGHAAFAASLHQYFQAARGVDFLHRSRGKEKEDLQIAKAFLKIIRARHGALFKEDVLILSLLVEEPGNIHNITYQISQVNEMGMKRHARCSQTQKDREETFPLLVNKVSLVIP